MTDDELDALSRVARAWAGSLVLAERVIAGNIFEVLRAAPESEGKFAHRFLTTDVLVLEDAARKGGPLAADFLRAAEIVGEFLRREAPTKGGAAR
ncbi:MAG: hypothetical protein ABR998_10425 [Gemmatimonadales bacterium]|jgi:hypothetical protein